MNQPPPTQSDDLGRLRAEYSRWLAHLEGSLRYSPFNSSHLLALQSRQRAVLSALRKLGIRSLEGLQLLELGCGSGGVLLEYLGYGASSENVHGVDLLYGRVRQAHRRLGSLPLVCADGQNLPYPSRAFDLVLQYMAFSSILDTQVRRNLATEMLRVLRMDGIVIWYDFWINPTNPHTRGIQPAEIRALFPNCRYDFRRVTLAPPLARRLVPLSRLVAELLEKLLIFNSHYLALIRPK